MQFLTDRGHKVVAIDLASATDSVMFIEQFRWLKPQDPVFEGTSIC